MTKASGFRYYNDGVLSNIGRNGYHWSSVPYSTGGGCGLALGSGIVFPLNFNPSSFGFVLCPVKE